jgi:hypothetical protein
MDFLRSSHGLLFGAALRCLQGVNPHHLFHVTLHVGGEIAGTPAPLTLGVGEGLAVDAARQCEGLATALAGLDNLVTRAAIVAATVFTHEGALFTLLDRLTKHALSLLSHADHAALVKMFGQKKAGAETHKLPRFEFVCITWKRKITNTYFF